MATDTPASLRAALDEWLSSEISRAGSAAQYEPEHAAYHDGWGAAISATIKKLARLFPDTAPSEEGLCECGQSAPVLRAALELVVAVPFWRGWGDGQNRALDAARAALARPPVSEAAPVTEAGLDEDRLIEALHSLHMPMSWRWWDPVTGDTSGTSVGFARAIVTAYQRVEVRHRAEDPAGEYGRLLATRDRLVSEGVEPADLLVPDPPDEAR